MARNRASAKAAGARWEKHVADYLKERGFKYASRRVKTGARDQGDINGVDNWILEAKDCSAITLGPWVKEAIEEAGNASVEHWGVVAKRRGHGDPGDAYVVLDLKTFVSLLLGEIRVDGS